MVRNGNRSKESMNPNARIVRNRRIKIMTLNELRGLKRIVDDEIKQKQGKKLMLIDEKGGKQ